MRSIGIVTPTLGRKSLRLVVDQLGEQMEADDRHIVILDSLRGSKFMAREIMKGRDIRYIYSEHTDLRSFSGAGQRDAGMTMAFTDALWFVDDDDQVEPGALEEIRKAIELEPDRPHFFRMERTGIWFDHVNWEQGRMGGSQIIWPNKPNKLPAWMPEVGLSLHGHDMAFTRRLLDFYPEGPVEHSHFILFSPVGHIEGRQEEP